MRLDDFDPNINVEDQGDRGGGFGGGGGGLIFGLLPLIGSRFGCGGIVVVLIVLALFGGLGNLGSIFTGGGAPTGQSAPASGGQNATAICSSDPAKRAACNAFSSAENTWEALFARSGERFVAPGLHFFDNNGRSGCGAAQSATGPFYCPTDRGIYLDTSFFDELSNRFGARGDFAQYYVIAHEFGHHIQSLTGASERVQQVQRSSSEAVGNAASVQLELQADCYAGVWAAQNRDRLEPGDVEEGMTAAAAIGDDTLTKGRASPETFTHGTSAQRQYWLRRGLQTGDPAQCDTFAAGALQAS